MAGNNNTALVVCAAIAGYFLIQKGKEAGQNAGIIPDDTHPSNPDNGGQNNNGGNMDNASIDAGFLKWLEEKWKDYFPIVSGSPDNSYADDRNKAYADRLKQWEAEKQSAFPYSNPSATEISKRNAANSAASIYQPGGSTTGATISLNQAKARTIDSKGNIVEGKYTNYISFSKENPALKISKLVKYNVPNTSGIKKQGSSSGYGEDKVKIIRK